jgi:RimJ/RimL family protein N-acetyltransferase
MIFENDPDQTVDPVNDKTGRRFRLGRARCLFEELDLDFITCGYFEWNRQSARVQEKCGFRFLKRYEYETLRGTREITVLNVLTREVWRAVK